ncbi:MAG: PAS domain-containing protein [Daejeonella sp.]|uniref:PAS domain-containing protein n=1 Tax=Daejeonella sp. TaxID=2805397 RepID=UPI003C72295A
MIALEDLKSLFSESPNAYLVLLPDAPRYTIAAANNTFLKYTHVKPEEIVGKGIFEAFPGSPEGNGGMSKGMKAVKSSLDQALLIKKPNRGVIQRFELENAGKYKTRFWILMRIINGT